MKKTIYFWNTALFLILSSLLTFYIYTLEGRTGIILNTVIVGSFLHLLISLIVIFGANFQKRSNLLSTVFNWLSVLFLLLWVYVEISVKEMVSQPEGGGFGPGFFMVFFVWPLLAFFTLASWISSVIFYLRNNNLTKEQKIQAKYISLWKFSLIFSVVSTMILMLYFYISNFVITWPLLPICFLLSFCVDLILASIINLIKQLKYRKIYNLNSK